MHRTYVITKSGDLKAIYRHAVVSCNPEMKKAIDGSLDVTVNAAQTIAPVYDREKWATWWRFEHHWNPPPGTLKKSVYHSKTVAHNRGAEYTVKYGSKVPYASFIENGFVHKRGTENIEYTVISKKRKKEKVVYKTSRKYIPGKHFMESSLDVVFPVAFYFKLRRAVEHMLTTPAI